MTEWQRVCVLCVQRVTATLTRDLGREPEVAEVLTRVRPLESGHVCAACLTRIGDDLADILRLAEAATTEPITGSGAGSRTVPSSRPPINVDGVDAALTVVPMPHLTAEDWPTVLEVCELWERMIREYRDMAPYGPVSADRARSGVTGHGIYLSGSVTFLRASLPWWAESPDQPIEDFAGEIRACRRVLAKWDPEREARGWRVDCPADLEGRTCGRTLYLEDAEAVTRCRKCGTEWTSDRLMLVLAETSDAHMWLDAEAICERLGVDAKTLNRWAREGRIERSHGLYDARPIALATRRFGT